MIIDKYKWASMCNEVACLMKENSDYLSEIDSKFGDGDHGVTIHKIAIEIESIVQKWLQNNTGIKDLFYEIGYRVTNINGGSAGPLYGTFFSGLGDAIDEKLVETNAVEFKKMLLSGLQELQYITSAKVGDKTMMDALIPAIKASQMAEDDVIDILTKAKDAAIAGAKVSENYISKFGRAKSYKEATIGTPDAGAVSCSYIFIGFYQAIIS